MTRANTIAAATTRITSSDPMVKLRPGWSGFVTGLSFASGTVRGKRIRSMQWLPLPPCANPTVKAPRSAKHTAGQAAGGVLLSMRRRIRAEAVLDRAPRQ